jgi:hypothetical protein
MNETVLALRSHVNPSMESEFIHEGSSTSVRGQTQSSVLFPKSPADSIAFSQIAREIRENNILIAERLRAHDPEIVDELILRYQVRLRAIPHPTHLGSRVVGGFSPGGLDASDDQRRPI